MAKLDRKYFRQNPPGRISAYVGCTTLIIACVLRCNCISLVGVMSMENARVSDSTFLSAPMQFDPWDIAEDQQDARSHSGPKIVSSSWPLSSSDSVSSNAPDTQPIQGWRYYCWDSNAGSEVCGAYVDIAALLFGRDTLPPHWDIQSSLFSCVILGLIYSQSVLECRCTGLAMMRVPQLLPSNLQRLSITMAGIPVLRQGLKQYNMTLQEV